MGKAYIDQERCLAWAQEQSCIVCEEVCPLPDKAIQLESPEEGIDEWDPLALKRPVVDRDACIGCGMCEYKCPVEGESAIRIYPASFEPSDLGISS
jgi:ferredoxin